MIGKLTKWRHRRYGSISTDNGEVFVHVTGFADDVEPKRGEHYAFDIGEYNGRVVATNVRPTD